MNINHKFPVILWTGVAIGLATATAIYAQQVKPAPGYFVAGLEITDPTKFQTFVSQVPGTLAPFGGHYIVRPSKVSAVEGDPPKIFATVATFGDESCGLCRAKSQRKDGLIGRRVIPVRCLLGAVKWSTPDTG